MPGSCASQRPSALLLTHCPPYGLRQLAPAEFCKSVTGFAFSITGFPFTAIAVISGFVESSEKSVCHVCPPPSVQRICNVLFEDDTAIGPGFTSNSSGVMAAPYESHDEQASRMPRIERSFHLHPKFDLHLYPYAQDIVYLLRLTYMELLLCWLCVATAILFAFLPRYKAKHAAL